VGGKSAARAAVPPAPSWPYLYRTYGVGKRRTIVINVI
jgi:hypothetical protein